MSFDIDRCIIKQVWCGDDNKIPPAKAKNYSRVGTRRECLRKGFGAGSATEKRKTLDPNSLQNISYVGDAMEKKFKFYLVNDIPNLLKKTKTLSAKDKELFLKNILVNKNGTLNSKAYNSVVLFLFNKGMLNLPTCIAGA